MATCTRGKTVAEWAHLLGQAGVPNSPIHALDEVLAMPNTAERGIVMDYEHGAYGPLKTMAMPVRFDAAPRRVSRPPPRLGEHTAEILADLGYDTATVEQLRREGVVRTRDDGAGQLAAVETPT